MDTLLWETTPQTVLMVEPGICSQNELVGRALFIYYPFTKRWGLSK